MNHSRCESPHDIEDSLHHPLLEPALPKYSDMTVRRAFIVWLRCGQKNKLRDACKLYHRLEAFEATLTPSKRAESRQYELDMYRNDPPTSPYLKMLFPNLYTNNFAQCIQEIEDAEDIAILQEFIRKQEAAAKSEIVQASTLIRNYCLTTKKTFPDFLYEFKEHTRICRLQHNVFNVMFYIRRKYINYQLENIGDNPMIFTRKTFDADVHSNYRDTQNNKENGNGTNQPPNLTKSTKKITILTNEMRKNGNSDKK